MAGPESEFWSDDVSKLKHFGEMDRVEDTLKKGVSDCVYCLQWQRELPRAGWLELKRLLRWPKPGTLIRLPHYTVEQVNYLERWGTAGMGAFLLAQVADEYLLFRWQHARAVYEGATRQALYTLVAVHGKGAFPTGRMLRALTQ